MLHIAQPENILPWFDAALAAGISDFDAIGLSYYPKWSITSVDQCGEVIRTARERYDKDVMIVETAYPWTLDIGRSQSHLMGPEAVLPAYSASPQGQRQFLVDLTRAVNNAGGIGVIY